MTIMLTQEILQSIDWSINTDNAMINDRHVGLFWYDITKTCKQQPYVFNT